MSLTREQVENYFKGQGRPDADEAWYDEFLNAGERQHIYDEIVQNDYDLSDVDRWFHLMKVLGVDLKFDTAMSINSALWEEDIETMELNAPDVGPADHLMAFIEQEVPYRLKNYLDYNVSDSMIAQIVAEVQENTDVMFDYDKFDDFLRNQCERMLGLDSDKIKSIKFELCNLRHELEGAIEFAPEVVPIIERRMRDLEIELDKLLKSDFKNNNFIDDEEKMKDFKELSKEEFLQSYSYLTEEEYDNTAKLVQQDMFIFDEEVLVNDDNESLNGYLWAVDALVDRLPGPYDNMENINFYADYNLKTGEIKLTSTYDTLVEDGELNKSAEISLNSEEKTVLTEAFEQYCRKEYGKLCVELVNEIRIEDGLEPISIMPDKLVSGSVNLAEDDKVFVFKNLDFPGHNINELENVAQKGSVDIPCRIYLEKSPCEEFEAMAREKDKENYSPGSFYIEALAGRDGLNEPWQISNWFVFYVDNSGKAHLLDDTLELAGAWDYVKKEYEIAVKKDLSLLCLPKDKIVLIVPEYVPDALEQDYSTGERFEFDSPEEFVRKYFELGEGVWVRAFDRGEVFCEGCIDDDLEMFEEYFGMTFEDVIEHTDKPSFEQQLSIAEEKRHAREVNNKHTSLEVLGR